MQLRKLYGANVLAIERQRPLGRDMLSTSANLEIAVADVLLLQVSTPDAAGRHSLGLVREYLPAVLAKARVVIAEVNPSIPWTHGGPYLQAGDFALLVDAEHPPLDQPRGAIGATEQQIARHIAGLIEDGAALQLGVGNLP